MDESPRKGAALDPDLRPEMALLLSCARTHVDERVSQRIEALVESGIDWTYLVRWSLWHHVTPLLCRNLAKTAAPLVPRDILEALQIHCDESSARLRFLTEQLLDILNELEASGIPAIPFKGPTLGEYLYGDLTLRPFQDLDFLLRDEDVDAALAVLKRMGYVIHTKRTPKQEAYFRLSACHYSIPRHDGQVWIEPHWSLCQHKFAVDIDHVAIQRRASRMMLNGISVPVFCNADLFPFLCTHGYRERWKRLKWVCDLSEFLRQYPDTDWEEQFEEARRRGILRMTLLGLALANHQLEARLPDSVLARIQADRAIPRLMSQVKKWLLHKQSPTVRWQWMINRFHWSSRERTRDKVTYFFRAQAMPQPPLFDRVSLPDSLFLAYYPLRWIQDFLLRPLRMAMQKMRGFIGYLKRDSKPNADRTK